MHSDNKIERPNEDNKTQKNNGDDLSRRRPQWLPRWLFNALGPIALLVLVFGGVAAYYAYHYVTKDSVRFQFWVGFMFSFMAFVVLLVQSVIYAQQAEFMKEQSRAMQRSVELTDAIIENMDKQLTSLVHQEKAMQGQLDAMKQQSDLIGKQVDLAVINERAYIALGQLFPPVFTNNVLIIVGSIVNGGRTPAWGLIRRLRVGVIAQDSEVVEPDWSKVEDTDVGLLLAGREISITFPEKAMNQELWDAVLNNQYKIVVDGELRYFDSLGGVNFYSFGVTYKVNPWRALQRYQKHRREKADPN